MKDWVIVILLMLCFTLLPVLLANLIIWVAIRSYEWDRRWYMRVCKKAEGDE